MELSPKENEAALAAAAGGPVANPNPPAPAQDVVHEPTPGEAKYLDTARGLHQARTALTPFENSEGGCLEIFGCGIGRVAQSGDFLK